MSEPGQDVAPDPDLSSTHAPVAAGGAPARDRVERLDGCIVRFGVDRTQVRFFVRNRLDIIQRDHFRGMFYESEELAIMADAIRPNSVIADIGANVGNHAVYFDKVLAAREVVLFEVNPEAVSLLLINKALNDCASWNTSYLNYAVSDKFAAIRKIPARNNNLGGTQFRAAETGPFRSIVGDSALANKPVDFIKIDVEGSEMAVLAGLQETVRRWRPSIFIEVGPRHAEPFRAFREAHGYDVKVAFNRHVPFVNYLIVPSSGVSSG